MKNSVNRKLIRQVSLVLALVMLLGNLVFSLPNGVLAGIFAADDDAVSSGDVSNLESSSNEVVSAGDIAIISDETSAEIIASGTCGDNLTWELDSEGTLTISGEGEMTDWIDYTYVPWYKNRSSIKKAVIEEDVTSIGDRAFYECDSLTSITIPDSVTSIGDYAFSDCDSLTGITIPDSVTSIGVSAFYYCRSLTGITIPDSVTAIGDGAFRYCVSLTSITIPDSVTSIGSGAFSGCDSLTGINVDATNRAYSSIDGVLFNKYATKVICYPAGRSGSYTIPDSVTSIGNGAFYGCDSLTGITIPDSVTSIGYDAFAHCDSLTSVTIPDSVTSIGDSVFSCCISLTSITIPDGVTSIGDYAFYNCNSLTSITIPDSVTSIGDWAFENCDSLTGITIPDGVTSIGYDAFARCDSLTSITIPDSVTSIVYRAFFFCDSLTDVYYSGSEEDWNSITIGAYNESLTNATIHFNYSPADWSDTVTIEFRDADTGEIVTDAYGFLLSDTIIPGDETFFEVNGDAVLGHTDNNYIFFTALTGQMTVARVYFPLRISTTRGGYELLNMRDVPVPSGNKLLVYLSPEEIIIEEEEDEEQGSEVEKKAIIVLPGMTGSELYGNTVGNGVQKVWIAANAATLHGMFGDLKCDTDGNSICDVFTQDESVSPYGTMEIFKALVNSLKAEFSDDYDVHFFSYDWRLSNSISTSKLNAFITDNKYDKVVLVCHSMGGIVASKYITNYGSDKVEKLITIGTPYYGSPKAIWAAETGGFLDDWWEKLLPGIDEAIIKEFAKNMPGFYELIPNYRYYRNGNYCIEDQLNYFTSEALDYEQTKAFFNRRSWFNPKIYSNAESFFDSSLYSTYERIISNSIDSYVIVGYNTKTLSCMKIVPGYTEAVCIKDLDINKWGDGTVPLISSTFDFADMTRKPYYVNGVAHTPLVKDGDVIALVKDIINGNGDNSSYVDGSKISRAITTEETFNGYKIIAACPVSLTAYDSSNNWLGTISTEDFDWAEGHYYDFYRCGENNEIKIAFLEDMYHELVISGSDVGTMDFAVQKIVDGEIVDSVVYEDVPITSTTIITTDTTISDDACLKVDVDNDAVFDFEIEAERATPATSVKTEESITLSPNKETTISLELSPDNATSNTIVFSTSDSRIATVDANGVVTAHALGTAVITASAGYASASCTVEVVPPISLTAMGGSVRIVEPYGLRFGIQLKKDEAYKQYKDIIVSYGTLIIPKKTLGDAELTFDVEKAMDVPAVNIYSEDSTQFTYTGVLVGIPKSSFYADIVGRGYLKYLDIDGNEKVMYTDEIVRSYYQVASSAHTRYGNMTDRNATEQAVYEKLDALLKEMA